MRKKYFTNNQLKCLKVMDNVHTYILKNKKTQ